jgi:hypothetical protein
MGWVISAKLRPLYRGEPEWDPELVWTGAENLTIIRNSIIINSYDFTTNPKDPSFPTETNLLSARQNRLLQ